MDRSIRKRMNIGSMAFMSCRESKRESGEIGRRTRLRIWRGNPWGFKSPLSHQSVRAGPRIVREESHHDKYGTARCRLCSTSFSEKCSGSQESDGVSVMRMHLKTG